ncbi:hypothetical protein [Alistipes sp. ZOR0009]|uniref:hypothetical protein n=1 Tax=Alistipes sp. ZOR0009 TaxID=1339253 RepID=UPI0012E0AD0F|nr:hypothetical protein [Alistipes sp. ZOR0009]
MAFSTKETPKTTLKTTISSMEMPKTTLNLPKTMLNLPKTTLNLAKTMSFLPKTMLKSSISTLTVPPVNVVFGVFDVPNAANACE